MFDLNATIKWITAVLKAPDATAQEYAATNPPFMQSLLQLSLPAYVAAFIAGSIIGGIIGGSFTMGFGGVFVFLMVLVMSIVWTFVIAFVLDFLAGTFGGVKNFDNAYALVALAVIPACIGTAVSGIAWIGPLLGLLASIYSIVLTYQFVPVFLKVPEENRGKHFGISVLILFLVGGVLMLIYSTMFVTAALTSGVMEGIDDDTTESIEEIVESGGNAGMFGGAERVGRLVEEAQQDTWDPPSDGQLTEEQVETYIRNMEKTRALMERLGSKLENMDKKDGEEPSLSDVFGGIGDIARIGTAETEVVKTSGGNWAEHLWVKSALETARVQQDLDDAVKHNYELFLQYQEQIEALD